MRMARSFLVVTAIALAAMVVAIVPSVSAATSVPRCGFIHASDPYTHAGHRYQWGVYVTGNATCNSGKAALNAVTHLNATEHLGSSDATSYFTYRHWKCPFGNMGFQSCDRPRQRPYRAKALAINCTIASGGCPATIPKSFL